MISGGYASSFNYNKICHRSRNAGDQAIICFEPGKHSTTRDWIYTIISV